ncbi:hypothetical protein [Chitinophaga sp.]|uniref:hypothetical protein n=1 Tax=Chitinophaga sp. TaxID=1869181 RepID=UPI0031DED2C9
MKNYERLKDTMDRRTYSIVRKELYAVCSRCSWHAGFWSACLDNPFVEMSYEEDEEGGRFRNYPNWKMVSKNRKQWMGKKFIPYERHVKDGRVVIYFRW